MSILYPEIEPYDRGLFNVGEGHRIYWESCGNSKGKPALMLHGDPDSGSFCGMRPAIALIF